MTDPKIIAVCGDWHGNVHWALNAIEYAQQNGAEHIVHVGDFGFWTTSDRAGSETYRYLKRLQGALEARDLRLWWLDGNHEHHPTLEEFVAEDGNEAPIQLPGWSRIHYLPRGYQWEWSGKRLMAVGGAFSIDRFVRTEGVSYWEGEVLTSDQITHACRNPSVDVVFSHDCPRGVNIPGIGPDSKPRGGADLWPPDMLYQAGLHRESMRPILEAHWPQVWFHGHYHVAHETWLRNTKFVGLDCDGARHMYLNVDILNLEELANGDNGIQHGAVVPEVPSDQESAD